MTLSRDKLGAKFDIEPFELDGFEVYIGHFLGSGRSVYAYAAETEAKKNLVVKLFNADAVANAAMQNEVTFLRELYPALGGSLRGHKVPSVLGYYPEKRIVVLEPLARPLSQCVQMVEHHYGTPAQYPLVCSLLKLELLLV